jgi:hypothetical protein
MLGGWGMVEMVSSRGSLIPLCSANMCFGCCLGYFSFEIPYIILKSVTQLNNLLKKQKQKRSFLENIGIDLIPEIFKELEIW